MLLFYVVCPNVLVSLQAHTSFVSFVLFFYNWKRIEKVKAMLAFFAYTCVANRLILIYSLVSCVWKASFFLSIRLHKFILNKAKRRKFILFSTQFMAGIKQGLFFLQFSIRRINCLLLGVRLFSLFISGYISYGNCNCRRLCEEALFERALPIISCTKLLIYEFKHSDITSPVFYTTKGRFMCLQPFLGEEDTSERALSALNFRYFPVLLVYNNIKL